MAISNILEATGPIVTKVYIELSWAEGTKLCSNGPGHKHMPAIPVVSKVL